MKITCERNCFTLNEYPFKDREEFEIDDGATVGDLFELFFTILRNEGYAKESVIKELEAWTEDGLDEVWL